MVEDSQMELDKLLDTKNKRLYDFLCTKMAIKLNFYTENNYGVFICKGEARIDIPENNYSSASFTHELLHILLSVYGVNISGAIKIQKNESKYLSSVISNELADHVSNVLEHRKMLPLFIELGYDRMSFLSDSICPVLTDKEVNKFKSLFKMGMIFCRSITHDVVDCYIAKYIAAKGACIGTIDYSSQISEMYKIEPELCTIMDSVISRWGKYDEKREGDILTDTYNSIVYDFLTSIEEWLKSHKLN